MERIKIFIAEICIAILRKLRIGVILGMRIEGGTVINQYDRTYWYDNDLSRTKTVDRFGNEYFIPSMQPFSIRTESQVTESELS